MAGRPNVLFILSDQQRWDTVGAYGCPLDLTPKLDAMARRGGVRARPIGGVVAAGGGGAGGRGGEGIARLRHLPAVKRAERLGLAELVAVCDAVGASAEVAARDFAVASWGTDYREAVARPDVDVVSVATPNVHHEEIAVAALQAGKHVMCEKPLAMDYPGALRMAEVARRSGRR